MNDFRIWDFSARDGVLTAAECVSPYVSGIERVAQRFLMLLLTEYGSTRYRKQFEQPRGTMFMTQWRKGEFRAESDLTAAFDVAIIMINSQLREEFSYDAPPEDQFTKAKLEHLVLTPDAANLVILIQSLTDEIRFILPLTTT
jgi:hypothetical protein